MFARWKFQIALIAMIAVFAILAGTFRDEPVVYAQDEDGRDYVDVGLMLEVPDNIGNASNQEVHVIVVNNGTRTAYDVVIELIVEYPTGSIFSLTERGGVQTPLVGRISVGQTDDGESLFHWAIPELGGLRRVVVKPIVVHTTDDHANKRKVHKISGRVDTASFQSDIHEENDEAEVWTYAYNTRNTAFVQVGVNYTVGVSVDNRFPARGDTVNFTVTAGRKPTVRDVANAPEVPPPIDLKVAIELTGGLTAGTPSRYYTSNDIVGGVQTTVSSPTWAYSNGEIDVGTGAAGETEVVAHSVILPVTVGSGTDVVVNEQCLTAKLTGNPRPPRRRHIGQRGEALPERAVTK